MTYLEMILDIIEVLIITIIFFKYFNINKIRYKIIMFNTLLIITILFNIFSYFSILLPLVIVTIEVSLTKLFCKNSIYEIISVSYFEFLNFSCLGVFVLFLSNLMNIHRTFNIGFIVYPIHFCICLLIIKIKNKNQITLPAMYWKYIAFVNVAFHFAVTYVIQMYFGKEMKQIYFIFIIMSIFFTVFILYVFIYKVYKLAEEKMIQDFEITKMKLQQENDEYIKSVNEQLRMIRHDLKHDYQLIQYYLNGQDYLKINELVETRKEDLSNLHSISCENKMIESLINTKIIHANKNHKKLYCQISYNGELKMKEYHLYEILSNLIDNAIEYGYEDYVDIKIDLDKFMLTIMISNTISDFINFETAKNKNEHGFGLKNVKKIVDEYQGIFEKVQENHKLNMIITIPNI